MLQDTYASPEWKKTGMTVDNPQKTDELFIGGRFMHAVLRQSLQYVLPLWPLTHLPADQTRMQPQIFSKITYIWLLPFIESLVHFFT